MTIVAEGLRHGRESKIISDQLEAARKANTVVPSRRNIAITSYIAAPPRLHRRIATHRRDQNLHEGPGRQAGVRYHRTADKHEDYAATGEFVEQLALTRSGDFGPRASITGA